MTKTVKYSGMRWRRVVSRRAATLEERSQPCEICQYPVSQRHHFFSVAEWGESDNTVQLCSNCHELYHLAYTAMANDSVRCRDLFTRVLKSNTENEKRCVAILRLCLGVLQRHAKLGDVAYSKAAFDRAYKLFGVPVFVSESEIVDVNSEYITVAVPPDMADHIKEGQMVTIEF